MKIFGNALHIIFMRTRIRLLSRNQYPAQCLQGIRLRSERIAGFQNGTEIRIIGFGSGRQKDRLVCHLHREEIISGAEAEHINRKGIQTDKHGGMLHHDLQGLDIQNRAATPSGKLVF